MTPKDITEQTTFEKIWQQVCENIGNVPAHINSTVLKGIESAQDDSDEIAALGALLGLSLGLTESYKRFSALRFSRGVAIAVALLFMTMWFFEKIN